VVEKSRDGRWTLVGGAFSALGYIASSTQGAALGFGWLAPLALENGALVPNTTVKKLECALFGRDGKEEQGTGKVRAQVELRPTGESPSDFPRPAVGHGPSQQAGRKSSLGA
jgi:hypothetical protein